jgi:hypothetical protein
MSEETQFWGVAVPDALGESKLLPGFRVYPVFTSRERAEDFVKSALAHGWPEGSEGVQTPGVADPEPLKRTLKDIRQIRRDEIPEGCYVVLDPTHKVHTSDEETTWEELLSGSVNEPPS